MSSNFTSSSFVVNLTRSPFARLKPVALSDVELSDSFWQPRRLRNRTQTLPSQYRQIEDTGRLANFRRAAGQEAGEFEGIFFNDSDVHKWLEALAASVAQDNDPALQQMLDRAAHDIAAAQQSDGFLNTYYSLHPEKDRWEALRDMHQLYCMGHFIQAAVTHFRATGNELLLDVARRIADCIDNEFGHGKREEPDGHQEIELALIELFRVTNDPRHLQLAQFFIDVRGYGRIGGSNQYQDHVPFRELDRLTGHAIRALYYAAGATDLFLETGEAALWQALETQWANLMERQLYISGGCGSRYDGEAFGHDWELPNQRAYTETCASIALVMWAWRMAQHAGEARFIDVMERALYNGVLSGLSLSGNEYFYQNPLADDGTHRRQPWFGCACCPPNIARLLAQLPAYFYAVSEEGVWIHLFADSRANLRLPDKRNVTLQQQTQYPWDGKITLQIEAAPTDELSLFIRIPAWAQGATAHIEEESFIVTAGQYLELRRIWQVGDVVTLHLPMAPRYTAAHPRLLENTGRLAVERGPLLYCVESVDCPDIDLRDIEINIREHLQTNHRPDLLGGVVVLAGTASVTPPPANWDNRLYQPIDEIQEAERQQVPISLIPYYAWANREPGQMQVWLKTQLK